VSAAAVEGYKRQRPVRVQPDGAGPVHAELLSIVPVDTTVVAFRQVRMQVLASGVYVPVYIPGRIG